MEENKIKEQNNIDLMTLDEAIKHCQEKSCDNNACSLEYKQLANWLIEFKELSNNTDKLKIENEELKNKLNESEKKYIYLQADLDNIRKRHLKTLQDKEKYEGESVILDILTILDNIEWAKNSKKSDVFFTNFLKSIEKNILDILNKYEVKPIYEDIRPVLFNNKYDDAISQVPVKDKTLDNSIYNVMKKGYFFKDKILRYESVIINKYQEND